MANIWAQQIVRGNKEYSQVPRLLRDAVARLLEEWGYGELVKG